MTGIGYCTLECFNTFDLLGIGMTESFTPHLSGKQLFSQFSMTDRGSALLLFTFSLRMALKSSNEGYGGHKLTNVDRFNAGAPPSKTKTGLIP
jgi:hypothetical protein